MKQHTHNQSYVNVEKIDQAKSIRNFLMIRKADESGVSGTGAVLHGSVFWNGKVSVCWITEKSSVAVYESFEDFKAIHIDSHPTNGTEVLWLDRLEKSDSISHELKLAIASFVWGTGCGCCAASDIEERQDKLAEMLDLPRYDDDSGYNWAKYFEEVRG